MQSHTITFVSQYRAPWFFSKTQGSLSLPLKQVVTQCSPQLTCLGIPQASSTQLKWARRFQFLSQIESLPNLLQVAAKRILLASCTFHHFS